MERDMDLARKILLEIEKRSWKDSGTSLKIEGYTDDQVYYHVMLLSEAGLIKAMDCSSREGPCWYPQSLTWQGHEFLDACREAGRWEKAKALIKEKAGAVGFEVLKALLVGLARESLGI